MLDGYDIEGGDYMRFRALARARLPAGEIRVYARSEMRNRRPMPTRSCCTSNSYVCSGAGRLGI
jgi:hypothetical protein